MWERAEHRLALLELVATGRLRRRQGQIAAWTWLAELSWTRRSGRRDEIALEQTRTPEARRLLDNVWPEWMQVFAALEAAGLPVSQRGWRQLQDIQRAREAIVLPQRLNRRTALARVGEHSKAAMSHILRQTLADTHLTHDGIIRLRPSSGLRLRGGGQEVDAHAIGALLGEVILTERGLLEGTEFSGTLPRSLLTVENLGPYLDICIPSDCLIAHVPGWNTRTIQLVFERLPTVPVVHFGDLDPNGVRIFRHLRNLRPQIRWLMPPFWTEFAPTRGLRAKWPPDLDLRDTPEFVQDLAKNGIWLEQEVITLDSRLFDALNASLSAHQL